MLNEAIRLVEELIGKKANIEYKPRHPADVLATWADISKAKRLLALRPRLRPNSAERSGQGWRVRASFAKDVAQLVAWYQANREWAKDMATW